MNIKKALIAGIAAVAFAVTPSVAFAAGTGVESTQGVDSSQGVESNQGVDSNQGVNSDGYLNDGVVSATINLGNGVYAVVIAHGGSIEEPAAVATQAKNTKLEAGDTVQGAKSLEVRPTAQNGATSATIIYSFDKTVPTETKLFAEHEDGTTDVYKGTTKDKTVTVEAKKLSVFTLVAHNGLKGANNSKKAPQTGVAFADVADFFADLF